MNAFTGLLSAGPERRAFPNFEFPRTLHNLSGSRARGDKPAAHHGCPTVRL